MFKTVTVSFRTKQELLEGLDHICGEFKCSRSSLIETILREFLSGKGGNSMPTRGLVLNAEQQSDAESDDVVHVSLGGVRLGLPKNLRFQIAFDEKSSVFQLELLPGEPASFRVPRPESTVREVYPDRPPERKERKRGSDNDPTDET